MITDATVFELGDAILLEVPRQLAGAVSAHLDRFVFSEDVQVCGRRSERSALGRPVRIREPRRSLPPGGARRQAMRVRGDAFRVEGVDLVIAAADAAALRRSLLDAGAVAATATWWRRCGSRAAGRSSAATWTRTRSRSRRASKIAPISRSKGCYVGQEVIVRVIDRGHGRVAERLVGLGFEAGAAVPASESAGDGVRSRNRPGDQRGSLAVAAAPDRARPTCSGVTPTSAARSEPRASRRSSSIAVRAVSASGTRAVGSGAAVVAVSISISSRRPAGNCESRRLGARDPAHVLAEHRGGLVGKAAREEMELDGSVRDSRG